MAGFWRDEIDSIIEVGPDGSDRVMVLFIKSAPKDICIINCYLPTNAGSSLSLAAFRSTLDEVHEIYEKYRINCSLVWAGDMNASWTRKSPNSHDRIFMKFCEEHHFVNVP